MQSRQHAARALFALGPYAASQVPPLIDALEKEEDPSTLIWMISALGNMKDRAKDAAPSLKKFVAHKEQAVRDAANKALLDFQEKPRIDDTPVKPKKQKAQ
jgi:HEAT repeat protein